MKKIRIALIAAILVALLIPMAVSAAGVFYCSEAKSSGGNGTYNNPWACRTQAQLDNIIYDRICAVYNGGHLYQIRLGGYTYYRIEWVYSGSQRTCTITYRANYSGYPPNTGVDLPAPFIISSAVGVGILLLVAGLALRRRKSAV